MDNGDEEIYYDQMASDWDRKQLCKVASNNLEKKPRKLQLERSEHSRALVLSLTSSCTAATRLKHACQGLTERRQSVEQQALEPKP
jgi:hypothetical protein